MDKKTAVIQIHITPATKARLRAEAKRRGLSMAKIISLGLEHELKHGSAKSVDVTRRILRTYTQGLTAGKGGS